MWGTELTVTDYGVVMSEVMQHCKEEDLDHKSESRRVIDAFNMIYEMYGLPPTHGITVDDESHVVIAKTAAALEEIRDYRPTAR
jgi:hypothetical protein